jgi:hypothetical protein
MIVGTKGTVFEDIENEKIIEIGPSWPEKSISTKFSRAFEVVRQKLNWACTNQDFRGKMLFCPFRELCLRMLKVKK